MFILVEKDKKGNVMDEEFLMFLGKFEELGEWVSFSEISRFTLASFGHYEHPVPAIEKGHYLEYLIPKYSSNEASLFFNFLLNIFLYIIQL